MKKTLLLVLLVFQIFTISGQTTFVCAISTSPSINTLGYGRITDSTAEVGGKIERNGGYNITDYGLYYGKSSSQMNYKVSLGYMGSQKGSFYTNLINLEAGTKWYYKFYIVNELNKQYTSSTKSFYTTDVRLLVDSDAVNGAGHIAILLNTSDGKFRYYSVDGPLSKGRTFVAFSNVSKNSLKDIYNYKVSDGSRQVSINSRYDKKFSILGIGSALSGTLDVNAMYTQAQDFQKRVNEKKVSYNVLPTFNDTVVINDGAGVAFFTKPYNCASFVAEVLNAGGVPNGSYDQIVLPNSLANFMTNLCN